MEYWMLRQYFMADTVTGPSWWKPPKVQGGNDTGTTKWKSVVLNRLAFPTALSKLSSNNFWQDSIGPGIPWCAWECPGVFDCQTPWDTWTKKHVHKKHHLIHVLPTLSIRTPQNWLFWGPYPCYTGSNPSIGGSKKNLRVKKDLMFKSSHQNIPSTTTAKGRCFSTVTPPTPAFILLISKKPLPSSLIMTSSVSIGRSIFQHITTMGMWKPIHVLGVMINRTYKYAVYVQNPKSDIWSDIWYAILVYFISYLIFYIKIWNTPLRIQMVWP